MNAGPDKTGEDEEPHAGYVAHVWCQGQILVDDNSEVTGTTDRLDGSARQEQRVSRALR